VVRLAAAGALGGEVLDAGCGTGDNALHVASLGLHVVGVDVAETAVSIARDKAAAQKLDAEFVVADALDLNRLGLLFDTVLDCGLFHSFEDERGEYAASLASVTKPGGSLYVLCFSDAEPERAGPHPVSQDELRAAFGRSSGWAVASIEPERLQASFAPEGAAAWLAKIERIE
jgi:ubiquinone/menaquinone biosynthesis C-methylase UbiE